MMEKLTKEDITAEIASLGGEEQSTKVKAIAEILKKYITIPRTKKVGNGLFSNCIDVNQAKYYLEADELRNNNIVIKSTNTKKILNNFKPVMKISKDLSDLILSTTKNDFNKEKYEKLNKTEKQFSKDLLK